MESSTEKCVWMDRWTDVLGLCGDSNRRWYPRPSRRDSHRAFGTASDGLDRPPHIGSWFHFSEPDVRTLAPLRFFWNHELWSRFGRLAANDDRHEPLVRPQKNAGDGGGHGRVGIPFFLAWCIGGTDPNIAERFGWSTTSFGVGITIILFAFPLAWLIRNRPEEVGLRPDGDVDDRCDSLTNSGTSATTETELVGYSWQQAIRTRTFWLISFGHACSSIVIVSIMVHLGLLLDDRGYSLPTISAIVGTYTGVNAVFILIGGYLGDRVPIRFAAFGFSFIQSFAVVILVFNDGIGMAFLFAVVLGIGFGGRTPVTTSIRGVYFGRRAFAAITGMSMVPMNVMLFAAPLFAGYMRDATGSYTIPFLVIAIVCMFGSCLFLLLGNPPTFLETSQSSQSN